ncbi:hypothetical protein B0H10DRAFT_2027130 [Mycena sp. CBHHK59/15]|nr:hypothetical protein B0H10DRAFT_2027130 [Mycena sp. CBHHK59/15]
MHNTQNSIEVATQDGNRTSRSLPQEPWLIRLTESFKNGLTDEQLLGRLASLNLVALQRQASIVTGRHCTGSYPLAKGGYNTVFVLQMEDGPDLIARLGFFLGDYVPTHEFSPEEANDRFLSEVATLAYVRKHTTIPVPEVYHYDADPNNAVGARYIIMEMIAGPHMGYGWMNILPEARRTLLAEIVGWERQLLDIQFPAGGSIGDEDGTIGPMCLSSRLHSNLRAPHTGPFASSREYLAAHCRSTQDKYREQLARGGVGPFTTYAVEWLRLALAGIMGLREDAAPAFVLFHDEFEMKHILVSPADPTKLIGLIDWEGSRVCPVWDHRNYSNFQADLDIDVQVGNMDPAEVEELREYRRATLMGDAQGWPYESRLGLQQVLEMVEQRRADMSNRSSIDQPFLEWFSWAEKAEEVQQQEIEAFLALKLFIECYNG